VGGDADAEDSRSLIEIGPGLGGGATANAIAGAVFGAGTGGIEAVLVGGFGGGAPFLVGGFGGGAPFLGGGARGGGGAVPLGGLGGGCLDDGVLLLLDGAGGGKPAGLEGGGGGALAGLGGTGGFLSPRLFVLSSELDRGRLGGGGGVGSSGSSRLGELREGDFRTKIASPSSTESNESCGGDPGGVLGLPKTEPKPPFCMEGA